VILGPPAEVPFAPRDPTAQDPGDQPPVVAAQSLALGIASN
jgi:hypothetical protein